MRSLKIAVLNLKFVEKYRNHDFTYNFFLKYYLQLAQNSFNDFTNGLISVFYGHLDKFFCHVTKSNQRISSQISGY